MSTKTLAGKYVSNIATPHFGAAMRGRPFCAVGVRVDAERLDHNPAKPGVTDAAALAGDGRRGGREYRAVRQPISRCDRPAERIRASALREPDG